MDTEKLTRRIEELERQQIRYRYFGAVVVILLVSVAVMGQTKSNVASALEAQSFVLRDKSGNIRGTLAVDTKTDASTLVLADKSGKIRTEINVGNDGNAGIAFGDASGKSRLAMGLKNNNSPDIGLADAKGVIRIGIGLQADGNPAIVFYDDQQKTIWRAPDRK